MDTGVYQCDPSKADCFDFFKRSYNWLAEQMKEKIGPAPEGIRYPAWAWYMREEKTKPDLRYYRWNCGFYDEKFVCMNLEVPGEDVLLSDFDLWHMVLNDCFISYSEAEDDELEEIYNELPDKDKAAFKNNNWQRVFDILPFENDWMIKGSSIQATFWEIKKEYIKNVKIFTAATRRNKIDFKDSQQTHHLKGSGLEER